MTVSSDLISRVRSNINEPSATTDPQRTDLEIAQWLLDGLYDYLSKIPADGVPEVVQRATFSGTYWAIPTDFIKLLYVTIDHAVTPETATTSTTVTEQCKVLSADEMTMVLYSPPWAGAWCKFDKVGTTKSIIAGPGCYSGTVTYIGVTAVTATTTSTFPLSIGHEEPIVNYATAAALAKINDEDAPRYLERYETRVAAEQGVKYTRKRKIEKQDPEVTA